MKTRRINKTHPLVGQMTRVGKTGGVAEVIAVIEHFSNYDVTGGQVWLPMKAKIRFEHSGRTQQISFSRLKPLSPMESLAACANVE